MKASVALLLASLALSGCAGYADRTYGSWLERVGQPVPAAVPLTEAQAQALRQEVQNLQAGGEALRMRLAAEPDRVRRVEYRRQLADIGERKRRAEQLLRNGGYEAMPLPSPPPAGA